MDELAKSVSGNHLAMKLIYEMVNEYDHLSMKLAYELVNEYYSNLYCFKTFLMLEWASSSEE